MRSSWTSWPGTLFIGLVLCTTTIAGLSSGLLIYQKKQQKHQYQQQLLNNWVEPLVQYFSQLNPQRHDFLRQWAETVTTHPGVMRVAILNSRQEPILTYPNTPADADWYKNPQSLEPFQLSQHPLLDHTDQHVLATVVMVIQQDHESINFQAAASPHWPIWILAIGFSVAAFLWLRSCSEQPLRQFLHHAQVILGGYAASPSPLQLADQSEQILDQINELRKEAVEWHDKTHQLNKLIDTKVQAQTRQVSTQLKQVERKAWTDPLTGLKNRHAAQELLPEIFQQARQTNSQLVVAMIDVDHFKNLNDTLGHAEGDKLLQLIGQLLQNRLESNNLAIRYGGDEFTAFFIGRPIELIAEQLSQMLALFNQHTRLLNITTPPTLSIGLASLQQTNADNLDEFIQQADEALYLAKGQGKNNLKIFNPEAVATLTAI